MTQKKTRRGRREGNDPAKLRMKILKTAREILSEDPEGNTFTIREIAGRCDVAVGLIPYYFGNRDNLLTEAVGEGITEGLKQLMESCEQDDLPATELLIKFLIGATDMLMLHSSEFRLPVELELKGLSSGTASVIIPLLRRLPAFSNPDDAYIAAMQILQPLQLIFLHQEKFSGLTDYRIEDEDSREKLIRKIVTNITA